MAPADTTGPVPVRDALPHLQQPEQPAPDQEPERPPAFAERVFEMEGERWVARVAGQGAGGTGPVGGAYVLAVQFARESAPDRPVREALVPRGSFPGYFDEELRALYTRAVEVVLPQEERGA